MDSTMQITIEEYCGTVLLGFNYCDDYGFMTDLEEVKDLLERLPQRIKNLEEAMK